MSTRHDRNFASWDGGGDDPPLFDVRLDPISKGWKVGTWSDTAKFFKRINCYYANFTIVRGGTEDAVDMTGSQDNLLSHFRIDMAGDQYVMTLKGGSCRNTFKDWTIGIPPKTVDIEIGNWSSSNFDRSIGNHFINWKHLNGAPVTYCYRFGCKPTFKDTLTKHLWVRSIGITVYWWSKYFWHVVLNRPDN